MKINGFPFSHNLAQKEGANVPHPLPVGTYKPRKKMPTRFAGALARKSLTGAFADGSRA